MKVTYLLFILFSFSTNFRAAAQDLSSEEERTINQLSKLRYNYPDSALSLIEDKIQESKRKNCIFG